MRMVVDDIVESVTLKEVLAQYVRIRTSRGLRGVPGRHCPFIRGGHVLFARQPRRSVDWALMYVRSFGRRLLRSIL